MPRFAAPSHQPHLTVDRYPHTDLRRQDRHGPRRISERRRHRPPAPMVRPANLPPFPYLGLPSPLSSSLTAIGASRSHCRPSLW
jgi:hypothetical protein